MMLKHLVTPLSTEKNVLLFLVDSDIIFNSLCMALLPWMLLDSRSLG